MEFERAAALRDRIKALTQVQTAQGINPRTVTEADLIALHLENGQACVQVFFIRAGQNWGNNDFYPRVGADVEEAEVLEAFLGQFYDNKEPPRADPVATDRQRRPDAEALSGKRGGKVDILVPKRGEKAELVEGALRNARESLGAEDGRDGDAGQSCCAGWPRRSASMPRRADRGLRQQPYPGRKTPWAP